MESVANQRKSLKAILDEKKDNTRVVLVYVRDDAQHYLIEQQDSFRAVEDEFRERDMEIIALVASTLMEPDRQFLMQSEFKLVPAEDYMGWLIGKDGTIKKTFTEPVDPKSLFQLIDTMPMRKQEMKKKH
ncbi:hypothetical protein GCM10023187_22520 [Nibrella viscosa]|uniref:DUF4174 domain-containing protein n=1 Tax=Nibrella viscosa TaxID=1084524 RepID=A0ABP8KE53_9BACT